MRPSFGKFIRKKRLALLSESADFSLRRVALEIGVEPSYLSKVERGIVPPPSEATILRLAKTLSEDGDILLALAGKVSTDVQQAILKRPEMFTNLIRLLKHAPNREVSGMVREARAKYGKRK
jgi:transcriptional regulator with XRE-family HTH domain